MIDLRQFRQFVALAEELSFRRAAARLNMAQPPLTAALRKLEAELGAVLIQRTNRVEGLTAAGEVFLVEARRALAQAERAIQSAKRASQGLKGSLRIAFVASAAHDVLPQTLRAFRQRHSDVELVLEEATTAQQIAALRQDRADIGFVVPPLRDAEDLAVVTIRSDHLLAAIPEGHPLAAQPSLSLADMASESWILFPARHGPGLHQRIVVACAQAGFAPVVAQEAVQMETIVGLVAGGLGVSLVPPSLARTGRRGVSFRAPVG